MLLEALIGVFPALISLLIALHRASEDESLLTTVVTAVLTYFQLLSWLPFVYSMVSLIIDISTVTQRQIPYTPLNPGEFENIAVGMALEYMAKALNDLITLIITAIGGIIASMIYRGIAGSLEDVASATSYSSA